MSIGGVTRTLNARKISTVRGSQWRVSLVSNLLERAQKLGSSSLGCLITARFQLAAADARIESQLRGSFSEPYSGRWRIRATVKCALNPQTQSYVSTSSFLSWGCGSIVSKRICAAPHCAQDGASNRGLLPP